MKKYKPVQALQRGTRILERVAQYPEGADLPLLAQAAGCSQPAAYHLAQTLVEAGLLRRTEKPVRYYLGSRLFLLAEQNRGDGVLARVEKTMREIRGECPEVSIFFCVGRGTDVLVILQMPAGGTDVRRDEYTLPPYTSMGSMMHLSYWPEDRVAAYRTRHSFDAHGTVLWGTEEALEACVRDVREQGHLFLPHKNPRQCRGGVPVRDASGLFLGSLTLSWDIPENEAVKPARNRVIMAAKAAVEHIFQPQTKEKA